MLEAMTVSPLAGLSGSNIIALRPVLCFVMAAVWNTIIFCPVVSFFVLSSFFPRLISVGRRLDVYHTSTHGVALVRI